MKKIILMLAAVAYCTVGLAQSKANPWAIGFNINPKEYKGELGNKYFSYNGWNVNPGLTVHRYVNEWIDVNLNGNVGEYDFSSDTGSFSSNLVDLALKARVKLDNGVIFKENSAFGPYLTAGLGFDLLDPINQNVTNMNFLNIPLGGGIRWKYNDWFNIGYEITHNMNLLDEYDNNLSEEGNDSYLAHQIGMNFGLNFGGGDKDGDSDGDGVADSKDQCPGTPKGMTVDENGCPAVIKEVQMLAKNIYFETASDVIKSESHASLDKIATIMANYPGARLQIEGHTDNTGDDAMNLDLSKRRAAAVVSYLTAKGVAASRLSSEGYGETRPVADNGTDEGRALNRRVEMLLIF